MELLDYVKRLKGDMDTVQGDESTLEYSSPEELSVIADDMKADAKEELEDIGVTLSTDDIILITYVYEALAIYLYRHDSNAIMDDNEDLVDMFIALLQESGTPEADIPEILENLYIEEKFRAILELNYNDDTPSMELTPFSKFILKDIDNEFKYIEPIKLVKAGIDKVFTLFDIEELENIEILYILSLFKATKDDIYIWLEQYPIGLFSIAELYTKKMDEFKLSNEERVQNE